MVQKLNRFHTRLFRILTASLFTDYAWGIILIRFAVQQLIYDFEMTRHS